ncbi:MAG: hypothetical protein ABI972_24260 [Acidobacteriota bacterium]
MQNLSLRLEKLERAIRPDERPMKIVVQYICPKTMNVVSTTEFEIGARERSLARNGKRR